MAFCTQCGNAIGERDVFCASCGSRQPGAAPAASPAGHDFLGDLNPRTAALLCYVPWWIGGIGSVFVLASSRFQHDKVTRFHAFQGLYLFVAWLLLDRVLGPMMRHSQFPFLPFGSLVGFLKLAVLGAGIFMIVKVSQNETFRLPFLGELADKSVAEQR